jgi:hypothetical protein
MVAFPDTLSVAESVLMIAAVWHGGDDVLGYLMDTENVRLDGNVRIVAPYWELSDGSISYLSSKLNGRVKFAFTIIDDMCLVDTEVVEALLTLGFHVDVFVRQSQLSSALN